MKCIPIIHPRGSLRRLLPLAAIICLAWLAGQDYPSQAQAPVYRLAFTRWDGGAHNLYLADTNGQNEQLFFNRAAGPSWSPDNRRLFFYGEQGVDQQERELGVACSFAAISNGIVAVDVPSPIRDICDVQAGPWVCQRRVDEPQSEPSAVCTANGLSLYQNLNWKEGTARWTEVSPDGASVAFDARPGADDYRILVRDLLGQDSQFRYQIFGELAAWSPDGQRLVLRSNPYGLAGLWISNRNDSDYVRLTGNGSDSFPAWSPDGRTIAFSRLLDGNLDIYTMTADGTNLLRLTSAPGQDTLPTYAPNGDIFFRSERAGRWSIWKMRGDGGGQVEIIPDAPVGPDWAFSRMDISPLPINTPGLLPAPTPVPVQPPTPTAAQPPTPTAAQEAAPAGADVGNPLLERVSVASDGAQAAGWGLDRVPPWQPPPAISADGRYVAFSSAAVNLVWNDINQWRDVFVRDRQTGQTTRVSISTSGLQGNLSSDEPAISADGRYVAFSSAAINLVPGDTNNTCNRNDYPGSPLDSSLQNCQDIFIHDRQTGRTGRVSLSADNIPANGASRAPALSADGRYIAFWSQADNLVPGDTNATDDVFIRDLQTGQVERVSIAAGGGQGNGLAQRSLVPWAGPPALSVNGRYVAFWSDADNLVPDDTNATDDVFIHDRQTGLTERLSVASGGAQADGPSGWPAISADGRYVAFSSAAANLVPGDTNQSWDIFVRDRETGETRRVSLAADGAQANNSSDIPAISADGRFIAFSSSAGNLVGSDTNFTWDIFSYDQETGAIQILSTAASRLAGDSPSYSPAISGGGAHVTFWSNADNLVASDNNDEADVFVYGP